LAGNLGQGSIRKNGDPLFISATVKASDLKIGTPQKPYISPICPEAPSGWTCTRFGLNFGLFDYVVV